MSTVLLLLAFLFPGQQPPPDPCQTAVPPFVVTSGSPVWISWVAPAIVTTPDGDVPNRIDGFYLQIDTAPRQDLGPLPAGAPCPSGTPQAGKLPFAYRTLSGVPRGSHEARITPWNLQLDAAGNPTSVRQEGPILLIPFVAADPVLTGPPPALSNGRIVR